MIKRTNNKLLKNIAIVLAIAIFFIFDRLLKITALKAAEDPAREIIGDLLQFVFTPNPYIAFSLPLSGIILNVVIAICLTAILAGIIISLTRKHFGPSLGLVMIFLGGASNLYDRLCLGYVIDYLYLKNFTIFNIADVLIVTGVIIILYNIIKHPGNKDKNQ